MFHAKANVENCTSMDELNEASNYRHLRRRRRRLYSNTHSINARSHIRTHNDILNHE